MPRGCVSLAFEKTWHGYADFSRSKPKCDYLAILPYSDEPTHVSEVVGIPPPLSPPLLPPPPPPLYLISNNSFSGDGAFYIHQCQVAHD